MRKAAAIFGFLLGFGYTLYYKGMCVAFVKMQLGKKYDLHFIFISLSQSKLYLQKKNHKIKNKEKNQNVKYTKIRLNPYCIVMCTMYILYLPYLDSVDCVLLCCTSVKVRRIRLL